MVSLEKLRRDIEAMRAQLAPKSPSPWPPTGGISLTFYNTLQEQGVELLDERPDGCVLPYLLTRFGDVTWKGFEPENPGVAV